MILFLCVGSGSANLRFERASDFVSGAQGPDGLGAERRGLRRPLVEEKQSVDGRGWFLVVVFMRLSPFLLPGFRASGSSHKQAPVFC
jgi:hypothetical protein